MTPFKAIVQFNLDRNLVTYDRETELSMLMEEFQELVDATSVENEYETIDALCDIIVVATGSIYKLGYDPDEALEETVKEITSRQGAINPDTGKWDKDKNQDPNTLYKANYNLAKR
jgi:NTP pyrophosphatase (non-canonical NTP hydrolase)